MAAATTAAARRHALPAPVAARVACHTTRPAPADIRVRKPW